MEMMLCRTRKAKPPSDPTGTSSGSFPAGVPMKGHATLCNGTVKENLVIWRLCQTTSVICIRHLVLLSDPDCPASVTCHSPAHPHLLVGCLQLEKLQRCI